LILFLRGDEMSTPYVSYCDGVIKLRDVPDKLVDQLVMSGAIKGTTAGDLSFIIERDEDRVAIFSLLRNMGFAFAGGREWSPAEQFEDMRDKGMLKGVFKCIVWRGPNEPSIREM